MGDILSQEEIKDTFGDELDHGFTTQGLANLTGERYEIFHGVEIMDSAIIAAATLSHRYISDRFLPDKAIDLIDEACSQVKTEMNSMPIELDTLQHKIMQLQRDIETSKAKLNLE